MTLNASGPLSLAGPTLGQSIELEIFNTATNTITLDDAAGRTLAGVPSGTIAVSNFYGKTYQPQRGIFGYGFGTANSSLTNLVSSTGVVATDTTGVGTARNSLAACGYGMNRGIFGYGVAVVGRGSSGVSMTNLVSSTGVVATDTTGVGTARTELAACGYGRDKGIFGYGQTIPGNVKLSMTNLVSNTGTVATDTTGVGTARNSLAACGYGTDRGIFGYGSNPAYLSMTNLVSSTGVVATDTTGVGTARSGLAACSYGAGLGIFGFGTTSGPYVSLTNRVSNTGVVSGDIAGVGSAKTVLAACGYGNDKGIFGYGISGPSPITPVSTTNLISNTGVQSGNVAGVGTARYSLAALSYSNT